MKSLFAIIAALMFFTSCGVQYQFLTREEARQDTSFIYHLPYPKGTNHLLVQGYLSKFSHRGRYGLDFKMKTGSLISAARSGVVVRTEDRFTKGKFKRAYLGKGNEVLIRHDDGTLSQYGHLQHNGVLVAAGDTVLLGQVIARSGSTGYSAFPHLHFMVVRPTPAGRKQLPARFNTKRGIQYLHPGRYYKSL